MSYQRAKWHSGLTYQQTCEVCKTVVRYTDTCLDFRPWYADGFVDCPKCKAHMRHNEKYALLPSGEELDVMPRAVQSDGATDAKVEPGAEHSSAFCTHCGYKFNDADRFCAMCGTKRT